MVVVVGVFIGVDLGWEVLVGEGEVRLVKRSAYKN